MEGIFTKNLFVYFLVWWYTESAGQFLKIAILLLKKASSNLSIVTILKTFFSPWKKISQTAAHKSIHDKIEAAEFNAVAIFVGMMMRTGMIIVYLIFIILYFVLFAVFAALWLILPFLPFLLVLYSFRFLI